MYIFAAESLLRLISSHLLSYFANNLFHLNPPWAAGSWKLWIWAHSRSWLTLYRVKVKDSSYVTYVQWAKNQFHVGLDFLQKRQ